MLSLYCYLYVVGQLNCQDSWERGRYQKFVDVESFDDFSLVVKGLPRWSSHDVKIKIQFKCSLFISSVLTKSETVYGGSYIMLPRETIRT